MRFVVEIITHLTGVVVQEVDRLTHFGDGVAEGFTRFTHQNADKLLHLIFHQHRRAFQNGGTLLRRVANQIGALFTALSKA